MSGVLLILITIVLFLLAFRIYGTKIARKLNVNNINETPSHSMYDGVDYCPAKEPVLLGHHFASIAGVGPIVGPIIAAGFGWIPVYIWVLVGAVFFGGVHDYTTIIASIRHKGKSIGQIIDSYIGHTGKKLFLFFAWATLVLVVAVFAIIVANTFVSIPSAATSSILFILLALLFGITVYRFKVPLWLATIIGVPLMFLSIYAGELFPLAFGKEIWLLIIFGYIFIASVTPVWILLQPRDYLNSYFLYALMFGGIMGLFFTNPEIHIPAFASISIPKVGYLFPALFVTVACGAISGFHSIVSSGTTSKQLDKESDAKMIGYGGMLIEGVLAVLALVAVGSFGHDQFTEILQSKGPVAAFSKGVANFIHNIPLFNIPTKSAETFVALAVAAFALTSLDTATRLGRYTFQEFFESEGKPSKSKTFLSNRFFATFITISLGALLTLSGQTMTIWPVFGSANQLLAALALLAITVWVSKLGKNYLFTLLPMIFMFFVTFSALGMLFYNNLFVHANYILAFISILLFGLAILLGRQAYFVLTNGKDVTLKEEKTT